MPRNTNLNVKNSARRFGYTKPTDKMKSGVGTSPKKMKKIGGSAEKISPFTRPSWISKNAQKKPDNIIRIDGKWTVVKTKK